MKVPDIKNWKGYSPSEKVDSVVKELFGYEGNYLRDSLSPEVCNPIFFMEADYDLYLTIYGLMLDLEVAKKNV